MNYTVNGEKWTREHNFCFRYEEIVESVGYAPSRVLTVVWTKPDGRSGTVLPGREVMVTDGTIINVADTSKA